MLKLNKPNKFGYLPIYIKITIARQTSFIATGIFIPADAWDSKREEIRDKYELAGVINPDLNMRKQDLLRKINEANIMGIPLSAARLKEMSFNKRTGVNIFDFIRDYVIELGSKRKPGTLRNYEGFSRRLEAFNKSKRLMFEEIDSVYLQRFEKDLRKNGGTNYPFVIFTVFAMICKAAVRKKLIKEYPLENYEMPVYTPVDKKCLSLEQLKIWEEYIDKTTSRVLKPVAIYFLLGCYTGLRVSDWKTFDIEKNVVKGNKKILVRARKNGELISMNISKPLARNLERMKTAKIIEHTTIINQRLKEIAVECKFKNTKISTHTGRHTFAVTICADQGITCETCAELMGIEIKTCVDSYYKVTGKKIDRETDICWAELE
jgi:site-specific recombinase XerD